MPETILPPRSPTITRLRRPAILILSLLTSLGAACGQSPGSADTKGAADGGTGDAGADAFDSAQASTDDGAAHDGATNAGDAGDTQPGDTDGGCLHAGECPSGDPCQLAQCVGGSCQLTYAAGAPCEDGAPCTIGDRCATDGSCEPGPNVCPCQQDSDCQGADASGDKCLGARHCDMSAMPWTCRMIPGSAPTCAGDTGAPCHKEVCAPATGKCTQIPTQQAWLDCTPAGCIWRAAPKGLPPATPPACNDGNPCTTGDICEQDKCQPGVAACECQSDGDCPDDGNICNGKPYCNKGKLPWVCQINPATVVACSASSDTACARAVCSPSTGSCAMKPAETLGLACDASGCALALLPPGAPTPTIACDDGNICTSGDVCKGGSCVSSGDTCSCASDQDCAPQEDGNACNGTLYCHKASGTCKLNPSTVVQCPSVDDTACAKKVCYPKTGLCQLAPRELTEQVCSGTACSWQLLPPGATAKPIACDDGDACSEGEACQGGTCQGGTDTCACSKDADCAKLEDGNHCNGKMFCDKVALQCRLNPASLLPCPTVADTACSKNACVPADGTCALTAVGKTEQACQTFAGKGGGPPQTLCVRAVKADAETQALPCDDGDPCTAGDTCAAGVCQSGATVCTCKTDGDCLALDDGNLCNGVPYCDKQTGGCKPNPSSAVACKTVDDTTCLTAACAPTTGTCALLPVEATVKTCDANGSCRREVAPPGAATPTAVPCEDGQPCTKGDSCGTGACKAGVFTCECATNADCGAKEDGDACNGTLFCDKSNPQAPKCQLNPATIVTCTKHSDPCLVHACDPTDGACKAVPGQSGGPCDDGSACSQGDTCKAGVCQGAAVDCDDGSACTNDSCNPKTGCAHLQANCADGNGCTLDVCDPKSGKCSFPPATEGAPCDADQSGCTVNDVCVGGACSAGAAIQCALEAGPCEQPVCVSKSSTQFSCEVAAKPSGAPCDDGDACTVLSVCKGGTCNGGGKERFFARDYKPPLAEGAFTALAPAPEGGLLLAGESQAAQPGAGEPTAAWWIARVDAAGDLLWTATLATSAEAAEHGATTAFAEADGTAWVAGAARSAKGDLDGKLIRLTPQGKPAFAMSLGAEGSDEGVRAAHIEPFGASTLVGWQGVAGERAGVIWRLTPSGEVAWTATSKLSGGERSWQALVVANVGGAGRVFVAGHQAVTAGVRAGVLAIYDDKGAAIGERAYGDGALDVRFDALLRLADGALVTAGARGKGPAAATWLVGVEADLYPRWSGAGASGSALLAMAAQRDEAGKERLLVAGRGVPLGGIDNLLLRGSDALGNSQWTQLMQAGGPQHAAAVVALGAAGKDGAAVAGERVVDGQRRGLLVRTDAFGAASCSASGACLTKTPAHCDDGKACTLDGCDAKAGCTATPQEALRCDPGDACSAVSTCAQGACAQTAAGRLHLKAHVPSGLSGGGWRLAVLDDGGIAAAGNWFDSSGRSALLRVDHRQDYRWHWTTTGGTGSAARGVAPVAGGGAMVLGRDNQGGWAVRRLDAHGVQVWAKGNEMLAGKDAVDLDYVTGNPHYVLCAQSGYGSYDWRAVTVHRFNVNGASVGTQVLNVTRFDPSQGACDANNKCYGKLNSGAWGLGNVACAAASDGVVHVVGTLSMIYCKNDYNDRNLFYARVGPSGVLSATPWVASKGGFGAWSEMNFKGGAGSPGVTGYEYAQAVEAMSDNGALIGAIQGTHSGYDCQWDHDLGNRTALIIRTNAGGQRLWHLAYNAGGDFRPLALGAYPGGDSLIGGYVTIGSSNFLRIERRDAAGSAIFAKTLSHQGYITDMAALPSGDIALTGASGGWLVGRIDRWGNTGCLEAGKCAAHGPSNCEDGKSCTTQSCTPSAGCINTATTGAACQDGDACTSGDVCQSDGSCKGQLVSGCAP